MKLDKHISDLLHQYDCVIIPEFGGFVSNYQPAKLDEQKHIFHPPSKAILFNKNLINNDGLLASRIAQAEHLEYDAANGKIKAYVKDAKATLDAGKQLEIEKVGLLYFDGERNIQFVADRDANFLMEAFGLNSIFAAPLPAEIAKEEPVIQPQLEKVPAETEILPETKVINITAPIAQPKNQEEKITVQVFPATKPVAKNTEESTSEEKEEDAPVVVRKNRWAWVAAASLTLMVGLGGTYLYKSHYTGQSISAQTFRLFDLTDWNTPTYHPTTYLANDDVAEDLDPLAVYEQPESVTEINVSFLDELESLVTVRLREPAKAKVDNTYVEEVSEVPLKQKKYHVIGGCFSEEANAEKLVQMMKDLGYNSHIVDHHKGLYRVAIHSYASRSEAKSILGDIREKANVKAWILKK